MLWATTVIYPPSPNLNITTLTVLYRSSPSFLVITLFLLSTLEDITSNGLPLQAPSPREEDE